MRLEPLEERDYEQIVKWIDSPQLLAQWAGTAFSYPLTESCLQTHFKTDGAELDRRGFKAIADDRTVGILELDRIDREHDSARISRVFVDPDERNSGVGTAMVRAVLERGFEDMDLHRIGLSVFEFNESAISCYETAGFVREGVRRDTYCYDSEYWTAVQMSILEEEWQRMSDR